MEIPYTVKNRPDTGLYNAKLGIWLFLASEVMLFGGLFSAYILLRVGAPAGEWPHGWQLIVIRRGGEAIPFSKTLYVRDLRLDALPGAQGQEP